MFSTRSFTLTDKGGRIQKAGSLQRYVQSDGAADEVSPSLFYVDDVHRIGVLDLRLYNLDRHTENLLLIKNVTKSSTARRASLSSLPCFNLVPIDHAYSLPSSLTGAFFEWQHWPQASMPFSDELVCLPSLPLLLATSLSLLFPALRCSPRLA